jgi:sugar-specific transcriptional regulator TrmB
MPSEPSELMKKLGFSDNECSIYLTLVSSPKPIPIDRLLDTSGIPTFAAEQAIRILAEKGAVRTVSNALEAVDPRMMLSRVLEEKQKELEQTLQGSSDAAYELRKLLVPKYSESKLGIKPEDIVEPLGSMEDMELRTVRIISNAQKEIKIFAESFGWYEKVREELLKAHDRGVSVCIMMLLMDEQSQVRARELRSLGIQVRHCDEEWYPVRGTIIDDSELVFLIWATKKKGVINPASYRPHYTKNAGLIRIFSDAFRTRWRECGVKTDP